MGGKGGRNVGPGFMNRFLFDKGEGTPIMNQPEVYCGASLGSLATEDHVGGLLFSSSFFFSKTRFSMPGLYGWPIKWACFQNAPHRNHR